MKRTFIFLLFVLTCRICAGQNLVANGDFEQYIACPTFISQLDSTMFWFNPTYASPDYFNQCGGASAGVPQNFFGYQLAHSGIAYGGIYLYENNVPLDTIGFREYIEVPLTTALLANTCYHFEMYINLANQSLYITDTIGIYFSDTLVAGITNYHPLPFEPQIKKGIINLTDTVNWSLISSDYIAHGSESYLIIGNFKKDSATDTLTINSSPNNLNCTYFYIDDVSLFQIPPCNTSLDENTNAYLVSLFPNPISDKINVLSSSGEFSEFLLYDITSRKLLQQKFTNAISINTETLIKGIYLYEVRNKGGVIKKGKVVKE